MRRVSISLMLLFASLTLCAQESESGGSLVFETTEWDFGHIEEVDGKVSHTFRYRNDADYAVAIERVYTSCGCTTGDYSRRPLKAGGEGTFTAIFDPEGRGGEVEKSLTIVYDGGKGRTELTIRGEVEPRPRTVADDYPYDMGGGIRCNVTYRAFGNVPQGESVSMTFGLANTSDKVVELDAEWSERSGAMELSMPEALGPGERALATMTYQPGGNSEERYGLMRDRFTLLFDGQRARESIVATAIGVDSFTKSRKSAKAEISPVYHNFGTVKYGDVCEVDVVIKNDGKKDLIIRSVELRDGTTIDLKAGERIAPGESITRRMTLRVTNANYSTLFGGVMIVVNDPSKPVRELRLAAEVE